MKGAGERTRSLKSRKKSNQQPASQIQESTLKSKSRQRKHQGQSLTACSVKCSMVEGGTETETEPSQALNEREAVSSVRKSGTKSEKYVGAHLSIQGGIWKAVSHSVEIGGRALGLFLRSPRSWRARPLEEKAAERFRLCCKEYDFPARFILPHSPYVMNLGSPKPDVYEKSRTMLVEELQCCRQLGLTLYNMHPGAGIDATSVDECLNRIADGINYAHGLVEGVTVVLENMSCQGTTIGGKFEELRGIIDRVQDKSRIGVCLDTCHAFAAGYDLSKKEGLQKMLNEFSSVVGLHYLKAVHVNDSKGALGCHLDRHENIGRGHIGLEGFRHIMNEPRFNDLPMILETPYSPVHGDPREEIELLYSFYKGKGNT
uniref:Probable endonuclease 4 isoform X2 n=1 Tax=Geotrypetes seraphini TaxID=260995 RepID=A0A6P8QEW8_GEOSA|nr:probable endonuclease 4 isoform X2 [Geotrypetes seraphini]